jgi:Dna[CI] antecedent, DciA
MERIGDTVERELTRFSPRAGMGELVAHWPGAVGAHIARNAWPARLGRDGTLHVATASSAWAFELTNLRAAVLDQLRTALGPDAPRRVVFAPGKLPATVDEPPSEDPHGRLTPSASQRAQAADIAAGVANEALRDRIAAAAAAGLARVCADRHF